MTEMEMLKVLRAVVAKVAGQNLEGGKFHGIREAAKAEVRQDLVDAVKERFGLGAWSPSGGD